MKGHLKLLLQLKSPTKHQCLELHFFVLFRFLQELGEGAFGKVYKGELAGYIGGVSTLVAIKTLKPGAVLKTVQDFVRESELMADLKHTNIVCLIGVCMQEEPKVHLFLTELSWSIFDILTVTL